MEKEIELPRLVEKKKDAMISSFFKYAINEFIKNFCDFKVALTRDLTNEKVELIGCGYVISTPVDFDTTSGAKLFYELLSFIMRKVRKFPKIEPEPLLEEENVEFKEPTVGYSVSIDYGFMYEITFYGVATNYLEPYRNIIKKTDALEKNGFELTYSEIKEEEGITIIYHVKEHGKEILSVVLEE